jgi:hypothetical protein
MPMQGNPNASAAYADKLLAMYKDPYNEIESVEFVANSSATLADAAVKLDIGSCFEMAETVTGVATSTDYFINAVEYRYQQKTLRVKWTPEPSRIPANVFILDSVTNGVLDTNVLG